MMVAVPHELVCTSAQSFSAAAARDVTSVHGSDGDHLPNTYAGQQFSPLVGRSKIQKDTQHLQQVNDNFQSVPRKLEAPPQFKCHQDSQERVVCHQEVVDLEQTHLQQELRQRPLVDTRGENVQQERHHKRVVRQDEADHQDGQQDGHTAVVEQSPPQSNGAQQQDPPQSNGAQQGPSQSGGAQPQTQPQSEGAPADSPLCADSRCSCEAVSWTVSVNCANSGLGELPAGIHPNTTRLILSGSNLQQISNDSLADLNRAMLLYLDNNNITDVDEDAFSGMRNLRVVDLSNNRLSALPYTAFRSSGKLQKLDLSGNPLQLSGGHLVDSASLYWLNLSRCHLASLPEDSFKGVPQMVMLDLSDNQLAVPTALALETLTGLRRLPLVGNPVSCCELKELLAWVELRDMVVTRRDLEVGPLPTCAEPASLRGRPWTSAAAGDACASGLDVAAAVGLAVLGLVALALLTAAALLLLRRRRRARRRRRTHSALRRQESHAVADDGLYEPPPKLPGWSGPLRWDGPRYVASFKASQSQPQSQPPPPPSVYDDAVGAGRHRKASAHGRDAPASPTYDDALGDGRSSPQYDYILWPDGRRSVEAGEERPPHHASIPSVLEGCDYYEDA